MPKVKNTTFLFIYELFFPDPETGGKKNCSGINFEEASDLDYPLEQSHLLPMAQAALPDTPSSAKASDFFFFLFLSIWRESVPSDLSLLHTGIYNC